MSADWRRELQPPAKRLVEQGGFEVVDVLHEKDATIIAGLRRLSRRSVAGYNRYMAAKRCKPEPHWQTRWYRGADIPLRVIRRFARQIAERFDPDRIILFGSYAYGTPHADSDVDILVVMPCRNQLDQAFKIHSTLLPPFPLDIIVRTPHSTKWRLAEGASFLTEITIRGRVLYEKDHAGMGAKSSKRLPAGRNHRSRAATVS